MHSFLLSLGPASRCRANLARIRQSRPDYGLGFQVELLKTFKGLPSSLRSVPMHVLNDRAARLPKRRDLATFHGQVLRDEDKPLDGRTRLQRGVHGLSRSEKSTYLLSCSSKRSPGAGTVVQKGEVKGRMDWTQIGTRPTPHGCTSFFADLNGSDDCLGHFGTLLVERSEFGFEVQSLGFGFRVEGFVLTV